MRWCSCAGALFGAQGERLRAEGWGLMGVMRRGGGGGFSFDFPQDERTGLGQVGLGAGSGRRIFSAYAGMTSWGALRLAQDRPFENLRVNGK